MRPLALALVHHPVLDRRAEVVTTAITNLDLHDICRSAYTYGLSAVYVTHPVAAQRELALRVKAHWTTGSGARRIPDRSPALGILQVVESLDQARAAHGGQEGCELWATSAQGSGDVLSFAGASSMLTGEGRPVLIAFGTGWGLSPDVTAAAAQQLSPIHSPRADGYNHLSVRAAVAIILDRLRGRS
ncbi:MAG: RNA methyltransferase [Polyangiaceae bacterium]